MLVGVLYNIRSVHNVGSIFRTADAAGFSKLYLCGITPTPLDRFGKKRRDFIKASLGAEDFVEWEYSEDASRVIADLKKDRFRILSLEQDQRSIPLQLIGEKLESDGNTCLVVGNEVDGVSDPLLKQSDYIVEIPMYGKKESLNVSVAFGIVAYAIKKGAE